MITREEILTGEERTYGYDYRNRLISVTDLDPITGEPTLIVTYTYNGLNRRISKSVDSDGDLTVDTATYFVYDREDVILDFVDADGDGPGTSVLDKRYLHGPGADMILAQEDIAGSTGVLWLLTDHLGTTRDIIDNSGVIKNHIKYDSFGKIIDQSNSTFGTRYLYTGREWDGEIELYYYRARFYDSRIGRFTQRDPIGFADGVNLYEYVDNNPIDSIDPTGLVKIKANGSVFFVHPNDADPFPSKPHAHIGSASGPKVHIDTGEVFHGGKGTGKFINRKTLKELRKKMKGKGLLGIGAAIILSIPEVAEAASSNCTSDELRNLGGELVQDAIVGAGLTVGTGFGITGAAAAAGTNVTIGGFLGTGIGGTAAAGIGGATVVGGAAALGAYGGFTLGNAISSIPVGNNTVAEKIGEALARTCPICFMF